MNIEIKFNDLERATEFANILKDENLRGARIKQAYKEPEQGSLDLAELMPLIEIAIQSGFAATVVTSIFGFLKGIFVENKKVLTDAEIEKLRIKSNERIEMVKLEKNDTEENKVTDQSLYSIEFMLEEGDKKVHFNITKGDETEQAELIKLIDEMTIQKL